MRVFAKAIPQFLKRLLESIGGLQQQDPLDPLLLTITMEVMSQMLHLSEVSTLCIYLFGTVIVRLIDYLRSNYNATQTPLSTSRATRWDTRAIPKQNTKLQR